MLFRAGELYQVVWKAIIRPPRDVYDISELGPEFFAYGGRYYQRRDFELLNSRKLTLKCSHFEPTNEKRECPTTPFPCVIYLHGNCSSRLEALNCGCLKALLPLGISVMCFDFSGSGQSGGDYVSLGWYEKQDLECVVTHLRSLKRISSIGLWGRSMGAVTACMFADSEPTIAGMVIDSPFSSLRRLAEELAYDFVGWKIPKLLLHPALSLVRSTVQTKAKFDIDMLQPIEHCRRSYIPALFIGASDDTFIRPQHCRDMHGAYVGDKNLIVVTGTHNSKRPAFLLDSISIFFRFALQLTDISHGVRQIWQDVAVSLALNEQSRRKHLMQEEQQAKQSANSVSNVSSAELFASKSESVSSDDSSHFDSDQQVNYRVSSDKFEDDSSLATAVAQMMILESIQGKGYFPEESNESLSEERRSESQSTSDSATEIRSSLPGFINMPVAPHRVKKTISSQNRSY